MASTLASLTFLAWIISSFVSGTRVNRLAHAYDLYTKTPWVGLYMRYILTFFAWLIGWSIAAQIFGPLVNWIAFIIFAAGLIQNIIAFFSAPTIAQLLAAGRAEDEKEVALNNLRREEI